MVYEPNLNITAQKSKCDQTAVSRGFGHIYWRKP